MIVGFKGESGKLKDLYKELGLKEVKPNTFEELENAVKSSDGNAVILNFNEIMYFEKPTADLVEKKTQVMNAIKKSKHNIYLSMTKDDPCLDRVHLDYAVCTKVNTKDIKEIESIFNMCNTDLPYSGKLSDGEYAVKAHGEKRAEAKSLSAVKKLIR